MATALVIVFGSTGTAAAQPADPPAKKKHVEDCRDARKGLVFYALATQRWYAQMDKAIQPRHLTGSCKRVRKLVDNWHGRAVIARQTFEAWYATMMRKWSCIHSHEGAWTADTGNDYYGGLQMTTWFQKNYGLEFWLRWGTANHWPPWAQIIAAERAWRGDGQSFRQWGTAGMCGLS